MQMQNSTVRNVVIKSAKAQISKIKALEQIQNIFNFGFGFELGFTF